MVKLFYIFLRGFSKILTQPVEQTLTVMQGGAVRLRQVQPVLPVQVAAGTDRRLRGSALKLPT